MLSAKSSCDPTGSSGVGAAASAGLAFLEARGQAFVPSLSGLGEGITSQALLGEAAHL